MSFFEPISGADFGHKLDLARAVEGARIIDVRSAVEYAEGHIPGAVNIPLNQIPLLDAPKDTELFKAVIQAAQPYLTQNKMDMRLTIAATPLGQQGVRGSEPFYSRVRGRVYLEDDEED